MFAYYEWAVIYLIRQFKPGFVARYCRGAPMSSGGVKKEFKKVLEDPQTVYAAATKAELETCFQEFTRLINQRNALVHAHPITDQDGSQILNFQAKADRPLPDMKWPMSEIETAISEFDAAACSANQLLHRLLK